MQLRLDEVDVLVTDSNLSMAVRERLVDHVGEPVAVDLIDAAERRPA